MDSVTRDDASLCAIDGSFDVFFRFTPLESKWWIDLIGYHGLGVAGYGESENSAGDQYEDELLIVCASWGQLKNFIDDHKMSSMRIGHFSSRRRYAHKTVSFMILKGVSLQEPSQEFHENASGKLNLCARRTRAVSPNACQSTAANLPKAEVINNWPGIWQRSKCSK